MTIEELLKCSTEQLEGMTDEELEAHFAPMFVATRPEYRELQLSKEKASSRRRLPGMEKKESAMEELARRLAPFMSKGKDEDNDE